MDALCQMDVCTSNTLVWKGALCAQMMSIRRAVDGPPCFLGKACNVMKFMTPANLKFHVSSFVYLYYFMNEHVLDSDRYLYVPCYQVAIQILVDDGMI